VSDARTFTLLRHGRTGYNARGLVNGDPSVVVELDDEGLIQARAARDLLAGRDVDLAIHTRFPRTRQTLGILVAGRSIPIRVYPELDDVHLGIFEGRPVAEYREWRRTHTPTDLPPGEGESRVDALYRYVRGFERMVEEDAEHILAVLHDVPIRFLLNGAQGTDPLDGPVLAVANAELHMLNEPMMHRALAVMRDRLDM
jgi:broad specificity phosphatase PhoE